MNFSTIKRTSFAAFLACTFAACNESEFLNLTNPNKAVDKTFWSSEANAQSAMATVYSLSAGRCTATLAVTPAGIP